MQRQFDIFLPEAPDVLAVHWGWVVALGILIALLGIVAIIRARMATMLAVGFLGVLLVVSAAAIFLFAITAAGYWTDFFIHVLWAGLVAIVGIILLTRPAISAEAITLLMAFYFIAEGLLIVGFAVTSHIDGLWIYLAQGIFSFVIGALLLKGWPFTGLWLIGTLVGLNLLFKGGTIIALGLGLRSLSEGALF